MTKPLFSIIIPAYNAQKHIEECLRATAEQTFSDFEAIIVDDGSTDATTGICERFCGEDKRFRLIRTVHAGVSSARNKGMKACRGSYVTFFDADDRPGTDLIELYNNAWTKFGNDAAFVMCGMKQETRRNGKQTAVVSILQDEEKYRAGGIYLLERGKTATLTWLKLFNFVTNKCYRLEDLKAGRIIFDENVRIAEDLKFNLDCLNHVQGGMALINRPAYNYIKRQHGSLSVSYYYGAIDHTKQIYSELTDFVAGIPDVSSDDVLVVKSIFLQDWVARLSGLYDDETLQLSKSAKRKVVNGEIQSPQFRALLDEVRAAGKISGLRYYSLKTGRFGLFYFLRRIYQILRV